MASESPPNRKVADDRLGEHQPGNSDPGFGGVGFPLKSESELKRNQQADREWVR
jgi:hypothetical protein